MALLFEAFCRWARGSCLLLAVFVSHLALGQEADFQDASVYEGLHGSPPARQLQAAPEQVLPPDTTLQLDFEPYAQDRPNLDLQAHPAWKPELTGVTAGMTYKVVELSTTDDTFKDAPNARMRIVDKNVDKAQAANGACLDASGDIPNFKDGRYVEGQWAGLGATTSAFELDTKLKTLDNLRFRMGGKFRICYSANGTFVAGSADVTAVSMTVNGVMEPDCTTQNCLSGRPYRCYLRKGRYNTANSRYGLVTSCTVDLPAVQGTGRGSWSEEFASQGYTNAGVSRGVTPKACGTQPSSFICSNGGACDAGEPFMDASNGYTRINLPAARGDLEGSIGDGAYRPRTVASCYCPQNGGCDAYNEYVQQIGVLHFYLSKVCHAADFPCENDLAGVTPQYRFRIRVECPTDACPQNDQNRMKLVMKSDTNDLPSWDSTSGCRSGVHGQIAGSDRLPQRSYVPIDGTAGGTVNPPNCDNPLACVLSGGTRQDYKEFGGAFGFRAIMGHTNHENLQFYSSHDLDVCFCQESCDQDVNWFKVGLMRLSPTRLLSSATLRSNLPAQWMIEYVNQPGILGISRPYADNAALGLQENGMLKLVKDPMQSYGDDDCAWGAYNGQYTLGLSTEVDASLNYLGNTNPPETQRIIFNSKSLVNTITVTEPGAVAVCYCAITVDNVCLNQANWKLLSHVTIKGPQTNQMWQFSTNTVFRFSYEGWGLTSNDQLRIISSDGSCTDNNFNPNTAAFIYTALSVKCPVPCTRVGLVGTAEPGDLSTQVLSADTWGCDRNNENCQEPGNDITMVTVLSNYETELVFQFPHGMRTGDEMTLGDNILCDPLDTVCTPEILAALKGVYEFADKDLNSAAAPDTYMTARQIVAQSDPRRLRMAIGWPESARPRFKVVFAGAVAETGYIGRGGKWTHHSRAQTREEILATNEKANMRVCWKFGGNGGKFVQEIGRVTIQNPAVMEGATVSVTASGMNVKAPMILQFRTATGVTGLRYDQAQDSLRLKIVFTHTHLLNIFYSDLDAAPIPDDLAYEVEEGKQSICGRLFLELWSNDIENGFPFPKGCYFKTYPGANQRELYLIFDAKNGLKKDTIYQMVFNGMVQDVLDAENQLAQTNFLELFPMDDVVQRPYEAIERGIVNMAGTTPQRLSIDPADPRFSDTSGFKIVGGYRDLLQIHSGDSITAELMGGATAAKILPGCVIRVYLWPLTMWKTTSSCTADCLSGAETSFRCTFIQCQGLPTVPGGSLNVIKMNLPSGDGWERLYGDKKVRVRIGAITIPSGGFFAQRLGAQVTTPEVGDTGDDRPHYIYSVGNYIWKEPNQGQTVSMVVGEKGGGNPLPFAGDQMNYLYARITLLSTIKARDASYTDASFTITLPEGYSCRNLNPLPDNVNAWEAESDLAAFGGAVPQGRGTVRDGTPNNGWTVSGNTCKYTPEHPHGIVFAGSSLVVKLTVDNPTTPLQRSDLKNTWTLSMKNKGLYIEHQTTQEYAFLATASEVYQSNNGVLGRITRAMCQPTNFDVVTLRDVIQDVRIFFQTEQEVLAGGKIVLYSPRAFTFGTPCLVQDLEPPYYALDSSLDGATLPLPGIAACSAEREVASMNNLNIAHIRLELILEGQRYFGFKIRMQNPAGYDAQQQTGWKIFTVDAQDFVVDGTPGTVPFNLGDGNSWGVYANTDLRAMVRVESMLPFVMTNSRTYMDVVIYDVPSGPSGAIRFTAPEGYVFRFTDAEFVYQALSDPAIPFAHRALVPDGVTATFNAIAPGSGKPYPTSDSGILLFSSGDFVTSARYGFSVPVEIPVQSPTSSSNSFFLELGYTGTGEDRTGAAEIPAKPVRALKNANLDYSTTVVGKENALQINIETITQIPEGGGLRIVVPEGFTFEINCEVVRQIDPQATDPPSLGCNRIDDPNEGSNGRPVVLLRALSGGLRPGLHMFAILVQNPMGPQTNVLSDSTLCGTTICWSFESFQVLQSATQASAVPLDYPTYTAGFTIRTKMLEARVPPLSEAQARATGRDDRPLMSSNVIFAFKLTQDVTQSGQLKLRGPFGFEFAQECGGEIEVDETRVFGFGNRFPPEFDIWPPSVQITSCRGADMDATLQLTFAPGAQLHAGRLYIFRIRIASNPIATPLVNRWNIEFAGESSEPIEGFTLWAFTRTSITPVFTSRDRTLEGQVRTRNPLRIRLRPFNTVPSGGELRAYTPPGFAWSHRPSMECDVQLVEQPYILLGVQYPGYTWKPEGMVCLVDVTDPRLVMVKLRDPRPLSSGLDYELILYVYNPATPLEGRFSDPTVWKISGFNQNSEPLDESLVTSFRLNTVLNLFTYENPNPIEPGEEMRNGGERLPSFKIRLRFPDVLTNGDIIKVGAPPGFNLADSTGRCRRFAWVSDDPDAEEGWTPLPNSRWPTCTETEMTIYIEEPVPVVRDSLLAFSLDLYNPLRTPFMANNFWSVAHYGLPDMDGSLPIMSSNAFTGWDIIPQLEDVQVELVGRNVAAESISMLRITFTAVSDAQDFAVVFNSPAGFDFTNAEVDNPMMTLLKADTSGNRFRLRMEIMAGDRVDILLTNVKLGRSGGNTDISLTTWVGGMLINNGWQPGTKKDEKLNFLGGFRLPGKIVVRYDKLENNYHQNPAMFPEQSTWSSQMGRPAYATFRFLMSRPVEIGHFLKVKAPPYELMRRLFQLRLAPTSVLTSAVTEPKQIANEIAAVVNGELHTRLLERLVPNTLYELVVSVIAPQPLAVDAHGGPVYWVLESTDNGAMPTNTNDGISREFPIVEEYGFEVMPVRRAPPTAEVEVSLTVTRGLREQNHPSEMAIIAPLGFNFSDNCLVNGGNNVYTCSPTTPTPNGRARARLTCGDFCFQQQMTGVRILVQTPSSPPVDPAWFVDGQDWLTGMQWGWGEAAGVQVEQMADTTVAYPGVGGVEAFMVWRFRTQVMVNAGGWLHVMLPEGLNPRCDGNKFKAISLPTTGGCEVARNEKDVIIYLNSTIVPGEYAFAITVVPPLGTPLRNQLSIVLKDQFGQVRDAAVNMAGRPIYEKLKSGPLPLQWTSSKALRSSIITIGFECIDPFPDIVVAPNQQINEVLITLPVGFQHLVSSPQDFTLVNEEMPLKGSLAEGLWLDFMQKDRLRIMMNLNRTSWTTLKVGRYQFRFPVLVPSPLPVFNVWHVSLCSPNFPEGCSRITDPAVFITYAYPGFNLGESYSSVGILTAGAVGVRGSALAAALLPALLLVLTLDFRR